jgi:hypothetical protein
VLQEISDRNIYPQAAYARQSLEALDKGRVEVAVSARQVRCIESMKNAGLTKMSTDELIARFAEIGVAQEDALLGDEYGAFTNSSRRCSRSAKS